jgi:hypothetical protein
MYNDISPSPYLHQKYATDVFVVQPQMASLLLVDSPAGVGYSYAENEDDYITNDSKRVVDLYDFLSKVRVVL